MYSDFKDVASLLDVFAEMSTPEETLVFHSVGLPQSIECRRALCTEVSGNLVNACWKHHVGKSAKRKPANESIRLLLETSRSYATRKQQIHGGNFQNLRNKNATVEGLPYSVYSAGY